MGNMPVEGLSRALARDDAAFSPHEGHGAARYMPGVAGRKPIFFSEIRMITIGDGPRPLLLIDRDQNRALPH